MEMINFVTSEFHLSEIQSQMDIFNCRNHGSPLACLVLRRKYISVSNKWMAICLSGFTSGDHIYLGIFRSKVQGTDRRTGKNILGIGLP